MLDQSDDHHKFEGESSRGKVVAVVSGKGGSGKTMLAVALAQGAALEGKKVILVDADFATGGLTYYLTFREFHNVRIGLSEILIDPASRRPLAEWAVTGSQDDRDRDLSSRNGEWLHNVRLVSIGDQRRVEPLDFLEVTPTIRSVLDEAVAMADLVVVDCRGGIDSQSLSVCGMADEILIVVETDATSIRSSQHLSDILYNEGLKQKVLGFVLNKVMDDPSSIAKTASSLFGVPFLGAVPFDIEATRAYIQGRIAFADTLFARHVFAVLPRVLPNMRIYDRIRTLSPEEFGTVTLRSPEVRIGGIALLALSLELSVMYFWLRDIPMIYQNRYIDFFIIGIANIFIVFSLSDLIKQKLGRIIRAYPGFGTRIFGRK